MTKPAGAMCNLACEYCYYLDKKNLYGAPSRASDMFMTDAMLERFVREYIEAQPADTVLFTWHGGETLLRDRAFYERALALQRKYAGGRQVDNCMTGAPRSVQAPETESTARSLKTGASPCGSIL